MRKQLLLSISLCVLCASLPGCQFVTSNGVAASGSSTPVSSENSHVAHAHFAAVMVSALNQVAAKTKIATIFVPTKPAFQPSAKYIAIKESSSVNQYRVEMFATETEMGLNDPSFYQLPYSSYIGMFGATHGATNSGTTRELNSEFQVSKGENEGTIDAGVLMTEYQTDTTYPDGQRQSVIEWNEGSWIIDVFGKSNSALVKQAQQIQTYLLAHGLPQVAGRILVSPSPIRPVTRIGWTNGDTLYLCEGKNVKLAVSMLASLRSYPAMKTAP